MTARIALSLVLVMGAATACSSDSKGSKSSGTTDSGTDGATGGGSSTGGASSGGASTGGAGTGGTSTGGTSSGGTSSGGMDAGGVVDAGGGMDGGGGADSSATDSGGGMDGAPDGASSVPCIWIDTKNPENCGQNVTIADFCPAGRHTNQIKNCSNGGYFTPDPGYSLYKIAACPDVGCPTDVNHTPWRSVECCLPGFPIVPDAGPTDSGGGG